MLKMFSPNVVEHALNAAACDGEGSLTSNGGPGRPVCTALTPQAAVETARRLLASADVATGQLALISARTGEARAPAAG